MKGIILDQFVGYASERLGVGPCESMLRELRLRSGGAFTTVGTYDAGELEAMVAALSSREGVPRGTVLVQFGRWVFPRLASRYGAVLGGVSSTFGLLRVLDGVIHVEVRKLYPDAELPSFKVFERGREQLEVRYSSSRHLEDLAEGLITGAALHFDESVDLERSYEGEEVVFLLRLRNSPDE